MHSAPHRSCFSKPRLAKDLYLEDGVCVVPQAIIWQCHLTKFARSDVKTPHADVLVLYLLLYNDVSYAGYYSTIIQYGT